MTVLMNTRMTSLKYTKTHEADFENEDDIDTSNACIDTGAGSDHPESDDDTDVTEQYFNV